jgi:hypothetical protein
MFVNPISPLFLFTLTAAGASAPSSEGYGSRSCAELAQSRQETDAAATRLAAWMERHCPGALEDTQPFCRLQSRALLERLADLGSLKEALAAKECESREVRDASAEGPASPIHLAGTPPLPVGSPRRIGSLEDNWPWPRRPTFQAGLAASAAFRIRKCQANPDCEW